MIARFVFITIAAILLFQFLVNVDAKIIRRDAPTDPNSKDAAQTIDEALQSLKTGLDDLLAKIQSNELVQNATTSLKYLGDSIQQQSKDLLEKIQKSTTTTTTTN